MATAGKSQLEAVWSSHSGALLALARHLVGPKASEVEDFVQETMARFIAEFPTEPPPEPRCGQWLHTTLTNLVIGDWRRRRVRLRAMSDPTLEGRAMAQPFAAPDAPRAPEAADAGVDLVDSPVFLTAVAAMSPKLRLVYELHMRKYSHEQIANQLGISEVAARKRLCDARKYLKKRLKLGQSGGAS